MDSFEELTLDFLSEFKNSRIEAREKGLDVWESLKLTQQRMQNLIQKYGGIEKITKLRTEFIHKTLVPILQKQLNELDKDSDDEYKTCVMFMAYCFTKFSDGDIAYDCKRVYNKVIQILRILKEIDEDPKRNDWRVDNDGKFVITPVTAQELARKVGLQTSTMTSKYLPFLIDMEYVDRDKLPNEEFPKKRGRRPSTHGTVKCILRDRDYRLGRLEPKLLESAVILSQKPQPKPSLDVITRLDENGKMIDYLILKDGDKVMLPSDNTTTPCKPKPFRVSAISTSYTPRLSLGSGNIDRTVETEEEPIPISVSATLTANYKHECIQKPQLEEVNFIHIYNITTRGKLFLKSLNGKGRLKL